MATYTGTSGNDTLSGVGLADDIFEGLEGNDTINGGEGDDKAIYSGYASDYTVTYNATTDEYTITDNRSGSPDGVDVLKDIEQVEFGDGTLVEGGDPLVAGDSLIEVPASGTADWKLTGSGGFGDLVYSIDGQTKTTTHNGTDYYQLTTGAGATVKVFEDGTYEYDATSTAGQDSFSYTVTDAFGISSTATVHIGVGEEAHGGTEIGNALDMDGVDDYLNFSNDEAGDREHWTFSAWVKRDVVGADTPALPLFLADTTSYGNTSESYLNLFFSGSNSSGSGLDRLILSNGNENIFETAAAFDSTTEWYHVVLTWDSDNTNSANRVQLHVNGERIDTWDKAPSISDGQVFGVNDANVDHSIFGRTAASSGDYFGDGKIADVHFIDGAVSESGEAFGQFDSNGRWVGKEYSGDYGKNGFRLDFSDDSSTSDLGNDVSGKGNDVDVNSIPVQVVDNPHDILATLDYMDLANVTLSDGDLMATFSGGSNGNIRSSLGETTGKLYWEVEYTLNSGADSVGIGIAGNGAMLSTSLLEEDYGFGYLSGGSVRNDGTTTTYGDSYGSGDIIGVALDLEAGAIWFSKNGVWQNGATQAEIEAGTTTNAAFTGLTGNFESLGSYTSNSTTDTDLEFNFGQVAFEDAPPLGFGPLIQTYDDLQYTAARMDDRNHVVSGNTISEDGLKVVGSTSGWPVSLSTLAIPEFGKVAWTADVDAPRVWDGIFNHDNTQRVVINPFEGTIHTEAGTVQSGLTKYLDGSTYTYEVLVDVDAQTVQFKIGGNDYGSAVPYSALGTETFYPGVGDITTGIAADRTLDFGQNGYVPPDGFSHLSITDTPYDFLSANGNDSLEGTSGVDLLNGGLGDDILIGNENGDRLDGGDGSDTASYENSAAAVTVDLGASEGPTATGGDAEDDTLISIENLIGSAYVDDLTGDAGDNIIEGLAGGDDIDGGAGSNDTASYEHSTAGVTIDLGAVGGPTASGGHATGDTLIGIENIIGSDFNDTLTGDANDNVIHGLDNRDIISGGDGNDTLYGGGGLDTLAGQNGNDTLYGGDNYDHLEGGGGDDTIYGGSGGDKAYGGAGTDTIYGQEGDDFLLGDGGVDTLIGGNGDDLLSGDAGADIVNGGDGSDTARYYYSDGALDIDLTRSSTTIQKGGHAEGDLFTSIENVWGAQYHDDVIKGDGGDNTLRGEGGDDTLDGAAGNDTLFGGSGADALDGGAGIDGASYYGATLGVTADLSGVVAGTNDALGDTYANIENLFGTAKKDLLYGDAANNEIYGQGDDDVVYGRDGNDNLYGGGGNDHLYGGVGADHLDGSTGSDTANYYFAASAVTASLLTNTGTQGEALGDTFVSLENLAGSEIGNDVLTGDANANTLWGNGGDDNLYGGGGNDLLIGGDGSDDLFGGAGADTLDGGAGSADWATYFDSTVGLTADLSGTIAGTSDALGDTYFNIENLRGSLYDDILYGDSATNLFWAEAGDDEVHGGGGNDEIHGSNGDDTLYGDDGADQLHGGNGDDDLFGGAGNDRLIGREGINEITGGAGNDTFIFGDFGATDEVKDFTSGDTLDVSAFSALVDLAAVQAATTDDGNGNTVIQLDVNDSVKLIGVVENDLLSGDFIFA